MGDTSVTFYSQPCRVSGSRVRSQTRASCLADTYTEHVTPLFTCSLPSPSGGRFSTANPKSDVEWKIYRAKKVRSQLWATFVWLLSMLMLDAHVNLLRAIHRYLGPARMLHRRCRSCRALCVVDYNLTMACRMQALPK